MYFAQENVFAHFLKYAKQSRRVIKFFVIVARDGMKFSSPVF